ncbi:MAG: CIA30 family protein [Pseudomonadota bacterium]
MTDETHKIIDALDQAHSLATNGSRWDLISDGVMGGLSTGTMNREAVSERPALRLRGEVSLANNGGFIQVALDLAPGGGEIDASSWSGIEIDVHGNGESYNIHLRTADVIRPWQSYRVGFRTTPEWQTLRFPFSCFRPHRLEAPLDVTRLRRVGVVAIGRAFNADISISGLRFFRLG